MSIRVSSVLLSVLAGGLMFSASVVRAADPVRGVTDTEIVIGTITDLSGVTAVQGVNNSDAVRMAFDEANAKGGIHGRKIKFIAEDNQYQVPRAVQAMNKLLNNDNVFLTIDNGGTPMNDANMPAQFAKNVPNMFPLTAARSMYEPYNKLKFGQFASYYDQMRSAVKYFAGKGRKSFCVMYQDSDFGKDVLAGVTAQTASTHLAKLLAGGLVEVEAQGRHRYYRLGGSHVALLLENLASVTPLSRPRTRPLSGYAQKLRFARCCYDHLAGQLGVAMTQALERRGMIVAAADKQFEVTPDGIQWFGRMGLAHLLQSHLD